MTTMAFSQKLGTNFEKTSNKNYLASSTPGPGTYRVFSEFGKYDMLTSSKNEMQISRAFKQKKLSSHNIKSYKRAKSAFNRKPRNDKIDN